eukprot:scaffold529_cov322-Pavlova_lutheri.AAC.13
MSTFAAKVEFFANIGPSILLLNSLQTHGSVPPSTDVGYPVGVHTGQCLPAFPLVQVLRRGCQGPHSFNHQMLLGPGGTEALPVLANA